jgi:hypothetical protein
LELEVGNLLKKSGAGRVVQTGTVDRGIDYMVERNGKRIGVEIKAWSRPPPRPILQQTIERVASAGRAAGATDVLLVVPNETTVPSGLTEQDDSVHVVHVSELPQALHSIA